MARRPDPARKPQLLADILEHLRDNPLPTITFRGLAESLDVSPFTLVYHFGTRNELIHEIIRTVSTRRQQVIDGELAAEPSLEAHVAAIRAAWRGFLDPDNRSLLRLEFEAVLMEVTDPELRAGGRDVHRRWIEWGTEALKGLGVADREACVEARLLSDLMYGFQFDLVVARDDEGTTAAFERAVHAYTERVRALLPHDGPTTGSAPAA